ncbi:MAG: four helix bundle protein [Candidatus Omnitrophota bacterium]|nr:four helix bundle protein [Candidatus Omnitrophota bacterium]MBU1894701.1 four helix bundle protein [Candidatus Omnitrophota bacterium]
MALYNTLPVFKKGYDLLIEIYKMTTGLSREYKYTVGEKLKNETLELLLQIYKANVSRGKEIHIDSCRESVEVVRLLIRLLHDLRQISIKRMIALNVLIENISKQLSGWKKSVSKEMFRNKVEAVGNE